MTSEWSGVILWILFAAMTAFVIAAVLRPLARTQKRSIGHEKDVALYKDQLAEIERDVTRGVMAEADAVSARLEVSRRLLAADDMARSERKESEAPSNGSWRKGVALATMILLPLGTLGLYLAEGSPDLPDQPFQARINAPTSQLPVEALVVRVEQQLKQNPDDLRGWEVLAPSYVQLRRYPDAAMAWSRAIAIGGETAGRMAALGEAQVLAANGIVTPAARKSLARAVELDPAEPRAQYYLGLADIEDGNRDKALTRWKKLIAEAPKDAGWKPGLEAEVARLESGAAMPVAPGPNAADVQAAGEMSADDRQAMIEGMVGRLATRLDENPNDLAGWLRLIRAYGVLGKTDEAASATAKAVKAFTGNDDALAQIEAAGQVPQ
ncbi:MAG: c-type cytochrome biogenesis protein CcmI [Rhizobiales bacterium]|nr:c-type cytochrome biogenesis protein CcmI [Hyphomicrobiales bacterium]